MSDATQKMLLVAGAAASAAAILYCLTQDNSKAKPNAAAEGDKAAPASGKSKVEEISKETVQKILMEIIESQETMKLCMKELTKKLRAENLSFEQTYDKVKEVQPSDPLENYNLSMMEFDQLLDKYQGDPTVREAIAKIMGAPNPNTMTSEKVQGITVKVIIEVHTFMLQELENLVDKYQGMQKNRDLDMKTVTIVAQAIVGAKMEQKFGITSEDIESAVLMYHTMLATDQEFANINMKIQHTMGKLMGQPFNQ